MFYDLNVEEDIDTFTLKGKVYEIPAISYDLIFKIQKIDSNKDLFLEWKKIICDFLSIRNEVNRDDFGEIEINNLVKYFKKKLGEK